MKRMRMAAVGVLSVWGWVFLLTGHWAVASFAFCCATAVEMTY